MATDPGDTYSLINEIKDMMDDINIIKLPMDTVTIPLMRTVVAMKTVLLLKKGLSGTGTTSILISQVEVVNRRFGRARGKSMS